MFTFKFKIIGNVFVSKIVRFKHGPNHWSVVRKKNHPIDKALAHFDEFYEQIYNKTWLEIRAGLLAKQKYVAVVNNYSDPERIMSKFEMDGALNVRRLFEIEKENILNIQAKRKRIKRLMNAWENDLQSEENLDTIKDDKKTVSKINSLQESLKQAEIDTSRLIDGRFGISAEILQEFIPATEIKGREDFISESKYYDYYDNVSNLTIKKEREYDIHFPENLNIYAYIDESDFDSPKKGSTGVLDYYLMDGGSIFPILALDIKPNNTVLDMCAAPGGKSLLALQTLYPESVHSNDVSKSRVDRIYNVYKQFLYDFNERFLNSNRVAVSLQDARFINGCFDRVLVDVPCTNDRLSLKENDNNIFKPSRIKERLQLPELQTDLLVQALKLVKIGGIVVYSTCSLSPIQNDGVVHMALKKIYEDTDIEVLVKDLNPALGQARCLFKLPNPKLLKYGHLIVPSVSQNFGPMYFCKIQRIK